MGAESDSYLRQFMTERTTEQTRDALQSSERLSVLALQTGQIGSWQLDIASQLSVRTLRHDQIFGYQEQHPTWTYESFLQHVLPQDRELVDLSFRQALQDERDWEFEARISRVDGEERWIWAKGQHFKDGNGKTTQIIGLIGDITERKTAELALRQSEKLAAVGRLASTIAHEINNPLEAVTNLLYLARGSVDVAEIQGYLKTADSELQRVTAITAETLRFHQEPPEIVRVGWQALLASVLAIFQGRMTRHRIAVQQRFRSQQTFMCFQGEVRQVLNNIVGNAVDAMTRQGGTLSLRSYDAHDSQTGLQGTVLMVADTGTGMDSATLKRIFDPFFSTKGSGGTGLGLWVSRDIVQRHHGAFHVRSSQRDGHPGTVFSLFLPANVQPERQRLK